MGHHDQMRPIRVIRGSRIWVVGITRTAFIRGSAFGLRDILAFDLALSDHL